MKKEVHEKGFGLSPSFSFSSLLLATVYRQAEFANVDVFVQLCDGQGLKLLSES